MDSWGRSACYPRRTFYPLSDGPPTRDHRITIAHLRAPPLLFGRRPPQSNCLPCAVPDPDNGSRLDIHVYKGGISRMAPPELAPGLHSLPPILHMPTRMPAQSYSKGARGLSV